MDLSSVHIVIPAKDEATRIGNVLGTILQLGYRNVVVIDDGSEDGTAALAETYGVKVLRHVLNLGAGAATQTGITYALEKGAEVIVTIDGDHQHLPEDIENLVAALHEKGTQVALGCRFYGNNPDIPRTRLLYNRAGNLLTFLLTGLRVNDSQSGMKAFRADFARDIKIRRNGFEFCVEIIQHIRWRKASWCEVPISVIYTADTMSKGQNFWSGVKMLLRLVKIS